MDSQRPCTTVCACRFPTSALRPGEGIGISTCSYNGFRAVSSRSLRCCMPLAPATLITVATRGQAVYADNSTHPSGSAHPQQVMLELLGSFDVGLSLLQPRDEISSRYLRNCSGPRLQSFKQRTRANGNIPHNSEGGQDENLKRHPSGRELGAETRLQQQQLGAISDSESGRLFVFGLGFTALALADYLKKNNWEVSGTCRSELGRAKLEDYGYSLHLFNAVSDGGALRNAGFRELQQASHWLVSIPPMTGQDKDLVLSNHWRELDQAVKNGHVCWIGYLSSTGVYGDWQGNWVDEESEPRPVEKKAVARLAAEKSWMKFGRDHRVPVHIFRLGGIYGPGRSVLDIILQKAPLSDQQQNRERRRFISRIHVEDVRQALSASMRRPCPGRIYNVVDDDPAPRAEVVKYAKGLVDEESGLENFKSNSGSVSLSVASDGPTELEHVAEKRVSNKRMKDELKIQLLYPTYKSGLRAILKHPPWEDSSAKREQDGMEVLFDHCVPFLPAIDSDGGEPIPGFRRVFTVASGDGNSASYLLCMLLLQQKRPLDHDQQRDYHMCSSFVLSGNTDFNFFANTTKKADVIFKIQSSDTCGKLETRRMFCMLDLAAAAPRRLLSSRLAMAIEVHVGVLLRVRKEENYLLGESVVGPFVEYACFLSFGGQDEPFPDIVCDCGEAERFIGVTEAMLELLLVDCRLREIVHLT